MKRIILTTLALSTVLIGAGAGLQATAGAAVQSDVRVSVGKCVPVKKCPTPTPTPTVTVTPTPTATSTSPVGSAPPDSAGYFNLLPVGSSLPSGDDCKNLIHHSTWEPRPDNYYPNHNTQNALAIHTSLARQQSDAGSYAPQWNDYMLPRVDGQFAGTTDEIFQWAACKWGLPDNVIRAQAVRESTWFQYEVYPSGRPVNLWGSGDYFPAPTADSKVYCDGIARFGRDYQQDYGNGLCPKTFSILGIMSWQAPSWTPMTDNQNGTFPFNRNSTAFAADYLAGNIRGCYEGWEKWLSSSGNYAAGDLWGCVGAWYSGDWHSTAANGYISRVQTELNNRTWLASSWPNEHPSCSVDFGCPVGWTGYPTNCCTATASAVGDKPTCNTAYVKKTSKFKASNVKHTHKIIFGWCVDGKVGWSVAKKVKDTVSTLNGTVFKCKNFNELLTKTYFADNRGHQLQQKNRVGCTVNQTSLSHTIKVNNGQRLYWGKYKYPLAKTYIQVGHLDPTLNQYKWITQRLNPYLNM
jgi:hypothetical protein